MKRRLLLSTVALALACAAFAGPARAQGSAEQEIVDKARLTVEKLRRDKDLGSLNELLAKAKGVLVIPSLLKAGFILGAEGGSGVLLARDDRGEWSHPAFYTMGSGSVGIQIGFQDAEVMLVIMTDKGLDQVIKSQFKLGIDASVAAGPIGMGVEAATTLALGADIYSFSKTRGAYGGGSLEGSVIYKRDDWNRAYYGRPAASREIAIERKFANTAADGLRAALAAPIPR